MSTALAIIGPEIKCSWLADLFLEKEEPMGSEASRAYKGLPGGGCPVYCIDARHLDPTGRMLTARPKVHPRSQGHLTRSVNALP